MAHKRSIKLRCPICKIAVKSSDPDFPFCSERCRLFDLGKWATGGYTIPTPITGTGDAIRQETTKDEDGDG